MRQNSVIIKALYSCDEKSVFDGSKISLSFLFIKVPQKKNVVKNMFLLLSSKMERK